MTKIELDYEITPEMLYDRLGGSILKRYESKIEYIAKRRKEIRFIEDTEDGGTRFRSIMPEKIVLTQEEKLKIVEEYMPVIFERDLKEYFMRIVIQGTLDHMITDVFKFVTPDLDERTFDWRKKDESMDTKQETIL